MYTALTDEGAEAEFNKFLVRAGLTPERIPAQDLVSIRVGVEPVLDLTDPAIQGRYIEAPEPLTGDAHEDWEVCRSIGDLARQQGYVALLVPSAALPGETNLVLYIDGTAGAYDLDAGGDCRPLNYVPA